MIPDAPFYGLILAMFAVGFLLIGLSRRPRRPVPVMRTLEDVSLPPVRWPALIDPDIGELDEATRIEVIARLGALPDTWSVDVLSAAYGEEREPAVRDTIVLALARAADLHGVAALRVAAKEARESERTLAIPGLAALGEVETLEALLGDASLSVALAALQALDRAGERERIVRFIAQAGAVQAAALRAALDGTP